MPCFVGSVVDNDPWQSCVRYTSSLRILAMPKWELLSPLSSVNGKPRSVTWHWAGLSFFRGGGDAREVQRIQQHEVYTTNISPLTAPSADYPVYTYENKKLKLFPSSLTLDVKINYLKSPAKPIWGFKVDKNLGHYIYNSRSSTDFEIHSSDQPLLISKILGYAGAMTKDQFAMSLANNKEQQINVNDQK